jgi:hypothetical protein
LQKLYTQQTYQRFAQKLFMEKCDLKLHQTKESPSAPNRHHYHKKGHSEPTKETLWDYQNRTAHQTSKTRKSRSKSGRVGPSSYKCCSCPVQCQDHHIQAYYQIGAGYINNIFNHRSVRTGPSMMGPWTSAEWTEITLFGHALNICKDMLFATTR